jgi:hypothetical protein
LSPSRGTRSSSGGAVQHAVQLMGGRDPGFHGAAAGHPQHPDHLDLTLTGLGRGGGYPGQGRPGGGLGVDRIRLAMSPPQAAVGPIDLDYRQAIGAHEPGQPRPGIPWCPTTARCGPGPRHVQVQVGVDPDGDRWGGCCHALHVVPSGLIGQGRHAPIGTADSTAMGPLGQAPIGSRSPDRWVPLDTPGSGPTDQLQGIRPVRLRVRPATEGTHPDHRSEDFLYELKTGPADGRRPPSAGDTTSQVLLSSARNCGRNAGRQLSRAGRLSGVSPDREVPTL